MTLVLETSLKLRHLHNPIWAGLVLAFCILLMMPGQAGYARQSEPEGAFYIVQEGDSLWSIALRFRVTIDDLMSKNSLSNPDQLTIGRRLLIPGLEGIQGELTTRTIPFGDTLHSLSRRYQLSEESLVRLNHLTSPAEFFAGATLVLPLQNASLPATSRSMMLPGQSLLELAVQHNSNPWSYVLNNNLSGSWSAVPGDVLHLPGGQVNLEEGPGALPETITKVTLTPDPLVQGKAAIIRISGPEGLSLGGSLNGRPLYFFVDKNGWYTSLHGIHALTEPGLYPLVLTGTLPTTPPYQAAGFAISQAVYVGGGNYPYDPPLTVSPETIDPAVTKPEDAQWSALAQPATAEKLWDGLFQSPAPAPFSDCFPSLFGNRRSYNGSTYDYFHTGLDFCGGVGIEIHAPAAGIVIFAGPLTVRGNATMINHGWGVYSGYMHQSELRVKVGDRVEPGQVIGLVGGTGRVTGPHLHFEIWVAGVQVDPLDWLKQIYPE